MKKYRSAQEESFQRACTWCALSVLGYLFCSLLGSTAGNAFLNHWMRGDGVGAPLEEMECLAWGINLAFSLIGLLIPLCGGLLVSKLPLAQMRCNAPRKGIVLPALIVYLGGAQIGGVLAGLVGQATGSTQEIALPESTMAHVLAFLVMCVVAPVMEELLFRGLMQGLLRPYGLWLAIVGQAVPFALLHGSAAAFVFALLAGLFFGWLAERSDSILPGMLLHFVNNTMAFLQVLLLQNGARQLAEIISIFSLIFFPLSALIVVVWWIRQGGLRRKLERVARVDRLLYSVPWVVTQIVLLLFSLFQA